MSLEAAIYNEARKAASGTPLWVSGMTVVQNSMVISPLDGMAYQRKTATGGGATDPYSDLSNYRPANFSRVSSISSSYSAGTAFTNAGPAANDFANLAVATQPVLVANVRTSVLSLSGRGALRFIGIAPQTGIASLRAEVELDGVVIFNTLYTSLTASSRVIAIGYLAQITAAPELIAGPDLVEFTKEAQVFFTSTTAQAAGNVLLKSNYLGYQS